MQKNIRVVILILLFTVWTVITYFILTQSNLTVFALSITASLSAMGIGIIWGKRRVEQSLAELLNEDNHILQHNLDEIIKGFKQSASTDNPLTELAMKLEETKDRETAARTGAAYLLATQPIFEISMEVISPRGDKEIITTVWGNREKPQTEKRIVLQRSDKEGNVLILSITTEPLYEERITNIGIKVLELIIRRWDNLIQLYTDPLTGARNRAYLPVIMNKLKHYRDSIAVFMIDLDHFKEVNDTLGHDEGDKVLVEVVKRMKGALRSNDEIIRYGGDEFIIIIRDVGLNNTYKIADRLKKAISTPPIVKSIPVSTSIGVAYKPKGRPFNPEKSLKIADEALYKAKEKRNTYYVFEAS